MAPGDVEVVRAYWEAWNELGVEAVRRLCTPDVEWHDPPHVPDAGVHVGEAAVVAVWRERMAVMGHFRVAVDDLVDTPAGVVTLARVSGGHSASGIPWEGPYGAIVEVRAGRASRFRLFRSGNDALLAARGGE